MKTYRNKTRKIVYQLLFAKFFWAKDFKEILDVFFTEKFWDNIDLDYLKKIYNLVLKNQKISIYLIWEYAPKFDVKKMPLHSTLPIFIAISEMFFLEEEIPAKVSINEAIEISKTFGDDSSKKIVNWVLNKIFVDQEKIKENIKNKDFLEKIEKIENIF